MTKQKSQSKSSTPRYEVLKGSEIVLSSNNVGDANNKLLELKKENTPKIIVRDYETKFQIVHSKDRYEKNYRSRPERFEPKQEESITEPEAPAEPIQE